MRRLPGLVLVLVALAAACGGGDDDGDAAPSSSSSTTATTASSTVPASGDAVAISDLTFVPKALTVAVGTEVTWTNEDPGTHTVTALDGAFDSGDVGPGATFAHTFEDAGTFAYQCRIHPSMEGEVVVEP